jgi:hypothetical protein
VNRRGLAVVALAVAVTGCGGRGLDPTVAAVHVPDNANYSRVFTSLLPRALHPPTATPTPTPAPTAPPTTPGVAGVTGVSTLTVPGGVVAFGDSVMIDAAPALQQLLPGIRVEAVVGEQTDTGLTELAALVAAHALPRAVVFALGTNGEFSSSEFAQLRTLTSGHFLVVLTVHCPYCSWTAPDNQVIDSGCAATRHCVVVDWNAVANAHPDWFAPDGVHMAIGGVGAEWYGALVVAALRTLGA